MCVVSVWWGSQLYGGSVYIVLCGDIVFLVCGGGSRYFWGKVFCFIMPVGARYLASVCGGSIRSVAAIFGSVWLADVQLGCVAMCGVATNQCGVVVAEFWYIMRGHGASMWCKSMLIQGIRMAMCGSV